MVRAERVSPPSAGLKNGRSWTTLGHPTMEIIPADSSHRESIHALCLAAFDEAEAATVAALAVALLDDESNTFHLVAEADGEVVGHVSFSQVWDPRDDSRLGWTLAPLAVAPDRQRQGIGSVLVREGLSRIEASGDTVVIVYGDPKYYGRFGFDAGIAEHFLPPYPLRYPFGWLAMTVGDALLPQAPLPVRCVDALCSPDLW